MTIRRAIRNALVSTCIAAATGCSAREPATRLSSHLDAPPKLVPPAPVVAAASAHAMSGGAPRARAEVARSAAGMVIARDPETGDLGMPSSEQMREIEARRAEVLRVTPEGFTEVRGPNGAIGLELHGRLQSYSVARVGPDGRTTYRCVTAASDTAAAAAVPALEER